MSFQQGIQEPQFVESFINFEMEGVDRYEVARYISSLLLGPSVKFRVKRGAEIEMSGFTEEEEQDVWDELEKGFYCVICIDIRAKLASHP